MVITKKKVVKKSDVSQNIPSILNKINNEKLRETLILLKTATNIKINYNTKLEDPKEIEEYFKEELEGYLNDKYKDIYEKVSELREKGHDMMVWTFKLMAIPQKVNVFLATGDKKDFNNVTGKMNEINDAASAVLDKIKKSEELYRQRKLAERKAIGQKQKIVKQKVVASKKIVKKV